MPNQSKSSKESNRSQESNPAQQPSQGKQATGSVQSSRDNPSRKGAAGEKEEGGGNVSFRCADLGHPECSWQATARNQEELLPKIQQHGREKHGIKTFDGQTLEKIRGAIRERAA